MSSYNDSMTLDLDGSDYKRQVISDTNDSFLQDSGRKFTAAELADHPGNIKDMNSASTYIERLSMNLEDYQSTLAFRRTMVKRAHTALHSAIFIDSNRPLAYVVECRLSELYQFRDDLDKLVRRVENNFLCSGKITLGNLNLELRVRSRDTLLLSKEEIVKEFQKLNEETGAILMNKIAKHDFYSDFFKNTESEMVKTFEALPLDYLFVHKKDGKEGLKLKFVADIEKKIISASRAEEDARLRELEWQIMTVNIKKSLYNTELKKLAVREQDLSRISKHISEENVKNAKDREKFEVAMENFDIFKYNQEVMFNKKVESINEALQLIEDLRIDIGEDSPLELARDATRSPSQVTEEIFALEKQLKDLEYEFRYSRQPGNLESLQTNINRLKNNILNLKSLNALQRNEKTSNALRNNMNKMDKQIDNSLEIPKNRNVFVSSSSDTSLKGIKKLPHHPLPAAIRISPLKKLEITTPKVTIIELSSPSSRKSPMRIMESPRSDPLSKQLRVREQILREKEEEVEQEERKLMELWMEVPEGRELVPILQKEIFEYRKMKAENAKLREMLEKEKVEWREKLGQVEYKEKKLKARKNEILEEKIKFEQAKRPVTEKLEWLKNVLMKDL